MVIKKIKDIYANIFNAFIFLFNTFGKLALFTKMNDETPPYLTKFLTIMKLRKDT